MALKPLKMPKKPLRKLIMPEKPHEKVEIEPEEYDWYACWPYYDNIRVTYDGQRSYWFDPVEKEMSSKDFNFGDDARADYARYLLSGKPSYINFTLIREKVGVNGARWTVRSHPDLWKLSLWGEPEQAISLVLWHQVQAAKKGLSG